MNVLVTGGAGYLGSSLVPLLLADPRVHTVTIYDSLRRTPHLLFGHSNTTWKGRVKLIKAELLDTRTLTRHVREADAVVHLAAEVTTPFADHDAHKFEQVNHWGTAQISYILETHPVSRFIYVSSTSVYGDSKEPSSVDTRPKPTTFYGISKLRGEDHARRLIGGEMKTWILRCGNAYGYNRGIRLDSVINAFMLRAHYGQRLRVLGDGSQCRSFIHVHRLAQGLLRFILGEAPAPGTYNLTETNLSIQQILDTIRTLYPEVEAIYVDQSMAMRNLEVLPDPRLQAPSPPPLVQDLRDFQSAFSF